MAFDDIDDFIKDYARKKVRATAIQEGVPPEEAERLAATESTFNPDIITGRKRSGVGAVGTMQLMPKTASGIGVNPYDLDQNIEGGVRYYGQQRKRFGNSRLAAAAYNAGPGAVLKASGVPNIPETQKYVQKTATAPVTPSTVPPQEELGQFIQQYNPQLADYRAKQAGRLINQIEGRKQKAVEYFQQADRVPDAKGATDTSGQPTYISERQRLRALAEGEVEAANHLAQQAQKTHGDLIEVGFGQDADPTSNRRWAYAKPRQAAVQLARTPSFDERAAGQNRLSEPMPPPMPTQSTTSNTGNAFTVRRDLVNAYARQRNVPTPTAEQEFQTKGYKIR